MLDIGAGRKPRSVVLSRYWSERLLYFRVVLAPGPLPRLLPTV